MQNLTTTKHLEVTMSNNKQMHKEQIIKTANDTDNTDFWVKYESFKHYYNETYK